MNPSVAALRDTIDWSASWLSAYRSQGEGVSRAWAGGQALHACLNAAMESNAHHHPHKNSLCFVPQHALPAGRAYEQFIFETGSIPTRGNLHDFFNGLVWLRFPQAKLRMNQLQAAAIASEGVQPVRGPLRDALTLFDENGAILQAPPALWAALRARQWHRLFVELRPQWEHARLVLVGHALLEKLVSPRKPMVAHVYEAEAAPGSMDSIGSLDHWLARELQPRPWSAKPFAPLPVLGVPGWWPANEEPGFYADPQVFRPPRQAL